MKTRKEMIAQYDIVEEGLQNLIDDLLAKPESDENEKILKRALRGIYADYGISTSGLPMHELSNDFMAAKYTDLNMGIPQGRYDHDNVPKLKSAESKHVGLHLRTVFVVVKPTTDDPAPQKLATPKL